MKKQVFLFLCCILLALTTVSAKEYHTDHFTINSDLEPAFVQFVQANAEAYYANMLSHYFKNGWRKPLKIYYSKTQAETQKLLREHDHDGNVDSGCYEPGLPAVYTHQFMNNGELNGWDALFHKITCHFIHQNFQNPPEWFNEGLRCFLRDQARIVRGKLIVTQPNAEVGQILKSRIDEGKRFNIKRLFSSSKEQLHGWSGGCQFAQVLFYWLNEIEQLKQYLANAQAKGYEFSVFQETLSKSLTKINNELADFIEAGCGLAAHLQDARKAEDHAQRQQAFLKVLQIKPDCQAARLDLAKSYNHTGNYENCRKHLNEILSDPQSVEFLKAATLMAHTYYKQKDYINALEHYNDAWEYSDCYEYKYKVAYQIANCYDYLDNKKLATQWYKKFLVHNWQQDKTEGPAKHARDYIEKHGCDPDKTK